MGEIPSLARSVENYDRQGVRIHRDVVSWRPLFAQEGELIMPQHQEDLDEAIYQGSGDIRFEEAILALDAFLDFTGYHDESDGMSEAELSLAALVTAIQHLDIFPRKVVN